jgi:actin-related protein 6
MASKGWLFIDNGGYSLKAMYFTPDAPLSSKPSYVVVPNAVGASATIGRGIVGTTLSTLNQYHSLLLRRPLDQGLLVDGELQSFIWDSVLQHFTIADEQLIDLVFTLPIGTPEPVAEQWVSTLTLAFRFRSVTIVSSSFLALVGSEVLHSTPAVGSGVVVDCGFSGCTITPYVAYRPMRSSIGRTLVGGKLLTNCLKEALSFSQINLLEDTWIVNCIKESCCRVAEEGGPHSLERLLKATCGRKRSRDDSNETASSTAPVGTVVYALPTVPAAMPAGCIAQPQQLRGPFRDAQTVKVAHESFVVPEVLFSPADIGLDSSLGVVDTFQQVVNKEKTLFGQLSIFSPQVCSSTVVFGGTANLAGFLGRFQSDIVKSSRQSVLGAAPRVRSSVTEDGQPSVIGFLGAASSRSIKHRSQELLPLVGIKALMTASEGHLAELRAEMQRRGGVAVGGTPKQALESLQRAASMLL